MIEKEYAENARNKILGGSRVLPVSQHLGAQSFRSTFQLWKDTYGLKFFELVLKARNIKADKLQSNSVNFKTHYTLTLDDILEYFAHLLVISVEKHRQNIDLRKQFLSEKMSGIFGARRFRNDVLSEI